MSRLTGNIFLALFSLAIFSMGYYSGTIHSAAECSENPIIEIREPGHYLSVEQEKQIFAQTAEKLKETTAENEKLRAGVKELWGAIQAFKLRDKLLFEDKDCNVYFQSCIEYRKTQEATAKEADTSK